MGIKYVGKRGTSIYAVKILACAWVDVVDVCDVADLGVLQVEHYSLVSPSADEEDND